MPPRCGEHQIQLRARRWAGIRNVAIDWRMRCGVQVTAFSLGFGPELFRITDRHGTREKVCAIPLGRFVKFLATEVARRPCWFYELVRC
jgi:hypothetical protein